VRVRVCSIRAEGFARQGLFGAARDDR
jgi:hypothetical protein